MLIEAYPCPCCENLTLKDPEPDSCEICPVCFWEKNTLQESDQNYAGGANKVSLNEARRNYDRFGAIEKRLIEHVRQPKKNERPTRSA